MKIKARLFAAAAEAAGAEEVVCEVSGNTVADVWLNLCASFPKLEKIPCRFALNQAFVSRETFLKNGDELALIPPVSGG